MDASPDWTRRESVETSLSAFGAAFAGLGAGLVLGVHAPGPGWPLLAGGILLHSVGMLFLHRRRRGAGGEQPAWLEYAYWLCWVVLVAVIGLVGWLALR